MSTSGKNKEPLPTVESKMEAGGLRLGLFIGFIWALFQLWVASPFSLQLNWGQVPGPVQRYAHLAFAFLLAFISFHYLSLKRWQIAFNWLLCALGLGACFYLIYNFAALTENAGLAASFTWGEWTIPHEALIGWAGILTLLYLTKRTIGWPLVLVASLFLLYSLFGPYFPDLIAHKGLSWQRLAIDQWYGLEGVFGIPIAVSVKFIFLFVVFGALLDRAGAGAYFIELAMSLVGRYRGGPAKGAVLASGMTGMVSGSSIANTVTTGTFTIPLMVKSGLSKEKAGAIEVAASTNGQIMPPIMGAAAFVMAELIGISYFDVVYHAFIPAVISYIALFYITDIEAAKLGLKRQKSDLAAQERQDLWRRGMIYFMPLILLVYLLVIVRLTTGLSIFWTILFLVGIIVAKEFVKALLNSKPLVQSFANSFKVIYDGLGRGALNMVPVVMALAAAGIIVGAVASTGLSNQLSIIVEQLAGNNIYILLGLVALFSIILGMGLPTTANYLVVATLLAPVIISVGAKAGLVLPLIAVHLYVFYFGLMADVTPPVALAAYAASGISKGDPFKTGVQAFIYSLRTAILPLLFIFNLDLLLIDVRSWWEAALIFVMAILAIIAFTSATFRWLKGPTNVVATALLFLIAFTLFRPDFFMDKFSPPVKTLAASEVVKGKWKALEGAKQVTAKVTSGGSEKILIFKAPPFQSINEKTLGLDETSMSNRGIKINVLRFMGFAETAGLQAGDEITAFEVKNTKQPSPKWFYLPACLLLFGLWWWQSRRKEI